MEKKKAIEFKEPEPEVAVAAVAEKPAPRIVRAIIHTSHSGDESPVQFHNWLYPEWGPRKLKLPRNEEVVVDTRILERIAGKHTLTDKVGPDGRPLYNELGEIVKIKKMCYPYTIVGDA